MIAVRIRVHDLDGGQMVPEYVGGSIPALKCRRCDRFVAKEATRLVERYGAHGRRVIMTLGRLNAAERYKGIDEVLELMPSLVQEMPDLIYLIAGDGDDRTARPR